MANFISRAWSAVAGRFTKRGPGEKLIVSLLPQIQGQRSNFSWTANRLELVNHFRGWNFVAINAVCAEIAGIFPQMAIRRDGEEYAQKRAKVAILKALRDRKALAEALGELHAMRRKYLGPMQRVKVLASVQDHEELEPVGPNHPALKLLSRPNPTDTWWTFAYKAVMYLQLTGSLYFWKVYDLKGDLRELWVLPSHWMWSIAGKDSFVEEYEVRPVAGYVPAEQGIGWFMGGAGFTRIKADKIICVQYPNPVNIFDGQSPVQASANWTQCSESVDDARTAAFRNEILPGVVVLIDKAVADPNPQEREALKARIMAEYSGVRKSRQPVVLAPGVTLAPDPHNTPVEMDFFNSSDQLKTYIMAAQKVGPSQVGMTEEVTFAGAVAAKANFHQCTIRPILLLIGEALTKGLIEVDFDPDGILYWKDATPEDPEYMLRKWDTSLKNGGCTLDEYRQHYMGLEPYPDGIGEMPILPNGMSPFVLPDDVDDAPLPALAALEQGNKEKEAEGALERGEGALDRGEAAVDKPGLNGKPRLALGQNPEPETPGDKARNRLREMSAGKRLREYLAASLNGTNGNGKSH